VSIVPELTAYELASGVPSPISFEHAAPCFKGMNLFSPRKLQSLLCASLSIKINRVMLNLAQRNGHPYFQSLDQRDIEIGSGKTANRSRQLAGARLSNHRSPRV